MAARTSRGRSRGRATSFPRSPAPPPGSSSPSGSCRLGDKERAAEHLALYRKYKDDENARDLAVARARSQDPAANHAAEAIVIYDLHRPEAFEMDTEKRRAAEYELQPLGDHKLAAAESAESVRVASAMGTIEQGGMP